MKKEIFLSILSTCFLFNLIAQIPLDKHRDRVWVMGSSIFFSVSFDKSDNDREVELINNIDFDFHSSNSSMCDSNGNLLFYTNGAIVNDVSHQRMLNGGALLPGIQGTVGGSSFPQTVISLPFPNNLEKYIIINQDVKFGWPEGWSGAAPHLYHAVIDMSLNNGLGAVIDSHRVIIEDTLAYGFVTAARHANGRDWWILSPEHNNNIYNRSLLDPSGVKLIGQQVLGDSVPEALGHAVFSPDGSIYARFSTISYDDGAYIHLYDFDRCTGLLSNPKVIFIPIGDFGGIAISPNSRYLYLSMAWTVTQYDLWSDDVATTLDTVAIYDGYVSPQPTFLGEPQLAPDNRIYMAALGSNNVLHYINKPNLAGDACEVKQHAVQLPTTNFSTPPNFPFFRLGALEGSPCDTLDLPVGINAARVSKSVDFRVFPNPAIDVVNLSSMNGIVFWLLADNFAIFYVKAFVLPTLGLSSLWLLGLQILASSSILSAEEKK